MKLYILSDLDVPTEGGRGSFWKLIRDDGIPLEGFWASERPGDKQQDEQR